MKGSFGSRDPRCRIRKGHENDHHAYQPRIRDPSFWWSSPRVGSLKGNIIVMEIVDDKSLLKKTNGLFQKPIEFNIWKWLTYSPPREPPLIIYVSVYRDFERTTLTNLHRAKFHEPNESRIDFFCETCRHISVYRIPSLGHHHFFSFATHLLRLVVTLLTPEGCARLPFSLAHPQALITLVSESAPVSPTALPFLRIVVAQLRAVLSTCQAPLADSCSLDGIGVIGIFRSAVIDGKIVFERVWTSWNALVEVYLLPFHTWMLPHFRHDGAPSKPKGKRNSYSHINVNGHIFLHLYGKS